MPTPDAWLNHADDARKREERPASIPTVRGLEGREPGLYVIFDGPPAHYAGRFVEVEDETGKSVAVGEWVKEDNTPYMPTWRIGPFQKGEAR